MNLIAIILSTCILLGGSIPRQTDTLDYSVLTTENHPRLLFNDEDFSSIKSGSVSSPIFLNIHDQILSMADSFIGAPELERIKLGKRLLHISRAALERMTFCAYAYKTTGEEKYLRQAEHDMITVCNFQDWNPSHFLDVGEMAAGVSLAYDWLYNELSDETKELVRTKIEELAFHPAMNDKKIFFYKSANNWNQVCNAGLICAALAIYEDNPNAQKIIERGVATNRRAMEAMYSPDGNYPEGYSYWSYGTTYQALMNTALETVLGTDFGLSDTPGFKDTGKFMYFLETNTRECFNYYDSTPSSTPALGIWYFAYKYGDLSNLYIEKSRIDSYSRAAEKRLLTLTAYYAYRLNLDSLDKISKPKEKIYSGDGINPVVLIHDNWEMDETDKFLGIKGGKAHTSHAHMDAGSFVYDAYGIRWADDMLRPGYGEIEEMGIDLWNMNDGSERWELTQYNNMNHNTLTVNGKYHKVNGMGAITKVIESSRRKGAVIDITAPLDEVKSAVRTIYMKGDDLIITDEIEAKDDLDAEIRWTMVTKTAPEAEEKNIVLTAKTGKKMYMKKSSATGHKPEWWTKENVAQGYNCSYNEAGYNVLIKAGTKARITIRLTPNE